MSVDLPSALLPPSPSSSSCSSSSLSLFPSSSSLPLLLSLLLLALALALAALPLLCRNPPSQDDLFEEEEGLLLIHKVTITEVSFLAEFLCEMLAIAANWNTVANAYLPKAFWKFIYPCCVARTAV